MIANCRVSRTIQTLLAGTLLLASHQALTAAITLGGEIDPSDAGITTPASTVHIGGRTSDGSLTIDQGSALISQNAVLGGGGGTRGTVTVTGTGSFWGVQDWLSVGQTGNGELIIADGGIVSVGRSTSVEANPPAKGTIRFDNGTLITPELFGSLHNLTGTGTIYTSGLVADGVDITVRSSFLPAESFQLQTNPDQDITVYLSPDDRGVLGAGFDGVGSLTIGDYHTVDSRYGLIGYRQGSFGTVMVRGNWNIRENLEVGRRGQGILRIEEHSAVTVQGQTTVGRVLNNSSAIEFNNGQLITGTLAVSPSRLHGNGTIHTQGLIADGFDLILDAQHGTTQTIRLNSQPDQDILIHLSLDKSSTLGAGFSGAGSLTIRGGVRADSLDGTLGQYSDSSGTADVSGEGTLWRIRRQLDLGRVGDGFLTIRDGALVMTDHISIGFNDEERTNRAHINLANGGMFAIRGKLHPANATLADFYESFIPFSDPLPDVLRYWDALNGNWSDLFNATLGEDYTLEFFDTGDLAGFTVLTVHTPTPEPQTAAVLCLGLMACLRRRKC